MPTFADGAVFSYPPGNVRKPHSRPPAEEAAKARALINFLMQDWHFLALYRSNDPQQRAAAMNMLNEAHHRAYGGAPAKDDFWQGEN